MQATAANGAVRYRLLEPLRQYAWELLAASGEQEALQLQHARYFVALAEGLAPVLASADRGAALDLLERSLDNLRAALAWALPGSSEQQPADGPELGLRLATALLWFWHFRGSRAESFRWLELALPRLDAVDGMTAAMALYAAGDLAWLLGKYEIARARLEQSVGRWRSLGDVRGLAYALQALACAADAAMPARWDAINESIALFQRAGDEWGGALARFSASFLALEEGDHAGARERMLDALARYRGLGDDWFAAQILNDLGDVARGGRRYAAAASRYSQSLALLEKCGDSAAILPSILYNLGVVALRRGQTRRALQNLRQALAHFRDRGDQRGIAECLIGLGGVLGAMQQPERAVRLYGAAEALLARGGVGLWSTNRAEYAHDRAAVRAQLSEETFVHAWAAGQALSMTQVLAEVLPDQDPAVSPAASAKPRTYPRASGA